MHNKFPTKFYFINKFKKNNIDKLDTDTGLIYRNYSDKLKINILEELRFYCRKKKIKFFLSNNYKLALKLKLDGVYLPSFNRDLRHLNYNIKKSFTILGSAHNVKEVRFKELQNVELIFISSIFKKNKNYLGLYNFKKLSILSKKKIIALGGISNLNKKKLRLLNCYGFSGISYFE